MGVKATLIERMVELLGAEFADDDTVGVVKAGPLHDDPTKMIKSAMIREIDPLDDNSNWSDRRYSSLPADQRDFTLYDEIGGNKAWYLRFVVELNINYARYRQDRENAHVDADDFKERIVDILDGAPLAFTEGKWCVYSMFVKRVQVIESGGEGAWQWKYALYCQAPAMHLAE